MKQKITTLLNAMKSGTFERDEALALSLLAALSGESIFLLGLPGVGKSMIARRLKLAFCNATVFEYLMSRFSTPDEIFGPVSISKLKDSDCFERVTSGFLPEAEVVFLDEIWKAGPAIQNSLLTVLNEKIYLNGNREIHLPLKGVIAASNELPAQGEGLEALWDRFLIRYVVNPIQDKHNFFRLVSPGNNLQQSFPFESVTNEEYKDIQQKISKIKIPETVLDTLFAIRQKMSDKANASKDTNSVDEEDSSLYYVSDRRWKKAVKVMQASALLNDRTEVNLSDLLILSHILWNADSQIEKVESIVNETVVAALFKDIFEKYKGNKRQVAGKKSDESLYSPNGVHYVIKCDGIPLKIAISDYNKIRSNPNEIFFGSETADNRIVLKAVGQYAIRFFKEGYVCINNFSYPLCTVSDNEQSRAFVENMNGDIEMLESSIFKTIDDNIFTCFSERHRQLKSVLSVYKKRLLAL
ncbi:MAG: AAA family ATPase [Muribaculaceae bacterium]